MLEPMRNMEIFLYLWKSKRLLKKIIVDATSPILYKDPNHHGTKVICIVEYINKFLNSSLYSFAINIENIICSKQT